MSFGGCRRVSMLSATLPVCLVLVAASCGGSDEAATATSGPSTTSSTTTSTVPETTTTSTTTTTTMTTTTTSNPSTTTSATAAPATTAPATVASTTIVTAPALEYCDAAVPLTSGAVLDSSLLVDMMGDGTADDLVEVYDVDGWSRLRLTTGGVVSEVINPAIDGRYRLLGIAPVLPGDSDELFAVIGEGSSAAEIGLFGIDSADCLFNYTYDGTSDDFTMLIRPSSPVRGGAFCFEGGIALYGAEQRTDGLWDAYASAFEIASPWTLQYMGASDDYSEGLTESDLGTFEFDCFGLEL